MEIKAIETEYKGYKFRSRLEARWAVFFDACGVKWEYEPEGFDLGDGLWYLPDFLLHDVLTRDSDVPMDLWVEVKGVLTAQDAKKISKFANVEYTGSSIYVEHPILVVGKIPEKSEVKDPPNFFQEVSYGEGEANLFNFQTIDGDWFGAFPCINNQGRLVIEDDNSRCVGGKDEKATEQAYNLARQARFENLSATKNFSQKKKETYTKYKNKTKKILTPTLFITMKLSNDLFMIAHGVYGRVERNSGFQIYGLSGDIPEKFENFIDARNGDLIPKEISDALTPKQIQKLQLKGYKFEN